MKFLLGRNMTNSYEEDAQRARLPAKENVIVY